jgi:hypothetical protein
MKRRSIFGMLLLVVLSGGCNNTYTVKTKINPDGSFEKTIVCDGDSLGLDKIPLPFVFKDGWKIDIRKDTGKYTKFITTARKTYADIDEFKAEAARGSDSTKLSIVSRIEKHFRWFFTYYTYQETIPAFSRFKQTVPFASAFTPAEIERLDAGKDSLLNNRYQTYWARNAVEEFIDNMIDSCRRLNDPALAPERWREKRGLVAEALLKERNMSKGADIAAMVEKIFQTSSVRNISGAIDTTFKALMEKVRIENELDISYKNEVSMPGMLITSNAKDVEGSTVTWTCRPHRFLDVVMTAESRMLNLWAVVVTAAVCLVLLAGLLLPLLRMRTRSAA